MRYNIYINGVRECPVCGAMAKLDGDILRCVDCKKRFRIVGVGQTDKDLEVEEINETTIRS